MCLSDFIAPKDSERSDYLGGFAVTMSRDVEDYADSFKDQGDDYSSILIKALGDRFAEALAEYMHKEIRDAFEYGKNESLSNEDLIKEKYRGIRPAAGYPACPDHTEKGTLWNVLDVEKEIGQFVRVVRKRHDLTQEELAQLLSISRITVQNLEAGKNFTIDTLLKVLEHFDLLKELNTLVKDKRNEQENVISLY